jgi:flagellar protein FliO/FliZ
MGVVARLSTPIAWWLCLPAGAAVAEQGAAKGLSLSPVAGGALVETAAGLLLILVLIIGLGWLVRRYGKLPMAGKGMVSVLGGVSLGPRERAVVLQVGDARLLVGVAPGRVQTLHVLRVGKESTAFDGAEQFSRQMDVLLDQESQ